MGGSKAAHGGEFEVELPLPKLERNPEKCERWYYAAATNSGKLRDKTII
jgi:hypothetical protein